MVTFSVSKEVNEKLYTEIENKIAKVAFTQSVHPYPGYSWFISDWSGAMWYVETKKVEKIYKKYRVNVKFKKEKMFKNVDFLRIVYTYK